MKFEELYVSIQNSLHIIKRFQRVVKKPFHLLRGFRRMRMFKSLHSQSENGCETKV